MTTARTQAELKGDWKDTAGSLLRLGVHPIGAALWLKQEEGRRRDGQPIRPAKVNATVTRLTEYHGIVLGIVILFFAIGLRKGLMDFVFEWYAQRRDAARERG